MTERDERTSDSQKSEAGASEKRGFAELWSARVAQYSEAVEDAIDSEVEETTRSSASFGRHRIAQLIVAAALRRATTAGDRRRVLLDSRPAAVVIAIPSSTWAGPVQRYVAGLRRNWLVVARSGLDQKRQVASDGNEEVAEALARGRSVIGIAVDPERQLPRTLLAAADVRIKTGDMDAAVVAKAMRTRFPGEAVTVPPDALTALEIDDLVAAMRPGINAEDSIELMRRASRRRSAGNDVSTAPDLATAVEFGAAREFGLALAQDIRDFKEGRQSWADSMKGGVVFGKPGTGKSVLCASIAAAAGVPLLRFSVAAMFDKNSHLGTVIEAMKSMMSQAAAIGSCCLVVLEELEFIPRRDRLDDRGGRSFWTPVIDLLLLLTDAGLAASESNMGAGRPVGVFILGCTNHLDLVEPALLRPNRLEVAIEVTPPNAAGVANVLRFHLGGALAGEDVSAVARSLDGATAAECMAVVRAAKRTARHVGRPMTLADLAAAAVGDDERSPQAMWRTAIHESAHAVSTIVTGEGGLIYVSIQGRGGRTKIEGNRDDLPTLEAIERTAVCLLAAGAAEASIVGSLSTGWSGTDRSDLGRVALMLSRVHACSGLAGNLFVRAEMDVALEAVRADAELGRAVEDHVRQLYARAVALVGRHRNRIVAIAKALLEKQHLEAAEVVTILSDVPENPSEAPKDRR